MLPWKLLVWIHSRDTGLVHILLDGVSLGVGSAETLCMLAVLGFL